MLFCILFSGSQLFLLAGYIVFRILIPPVNGLPDGHVPEILIAMLFPFPMTLLPDSKDNVFPLMSFTSRPSMMIHKTPLLHSDVSPKYSTKSISSSKTAIKF